MLSSVAQLGNYIIKNEGKDLNNPMSILIENPNVNGKYKNILKITFDYNTLEYLGVYPDEFDKTKHLLKLMYKKSRGANDADFSPTSKIAGDTERTLKKKIIRAVSKTRKYEKYKNSNFLKKLEKSLKDNEDKILKDILNKKGKDGTILTITFKDGENEYFVGDIEEFINYFIHKATMDYYYMTTGNIISKGSGICSICNKENEEVYGVFGRFKFYSIDKIGNVSGFNPNNAWKTFPICLKCALAVEEGKKYLDENLRGKFYGTEFYMIPKVLFDKDMERILNSYNDLVKNVKNRDYSKREKLLLRFLKNSDIYCYTTFMFFNEGNDFKVLQMIEDVLPSRFSVLYNAMEKTENIPLFKNYKINKNNLKKLNKNQRKYFASIFKNNEDLEELKFLFGYIKEFVDNDNEVFLKLMNNIFSNKKIDYHYLINQFISKIRREFKTSESISLSAYKSLMIIYFLINTNLLSNNLKSRGEIITEKSIYDYGEIDKFFEDYKDFFNSEDKKAVFLTGVLVDKLLRLQYQKRQSKPFLAKLHGLKLDKSKIESIFKEATQKLMEYGQEDNINYYSRLKEETARRFITSGDNWNLSNNEISYIFSLGLAMSSVFDNLKNNKNNKGEDDE
ncbi:TIGR02556 family CRISPR-associated protein [Methanothermococcus sp.]|uniref:TIGR02556 family CRISPR-associated protein n=1 Tax=Methanothermococcus sp. TaxID=2614238 RepID=UPI0025D2D80D|nr:TIGR02556 family CRISPR-associated protein [Methanothermococcus sp.]